jgi:hypothetical protein
MSDGNGRPLQKNGFLAKKPGRMWVLYVNDMFISDEKEFLEELEKAGLYKNQF